VTKEFFIEQIFIAASGGKLSADSNIRREDIAAYVPAAVNAAILQDFYETRNRSREDRQEFFTSREDIGAESFQTFTVPVESGGKITLPKTLMSLPFGRGFGGVYQDIDNPFVRVHSPIEVAGLPTGDVVWFWQEGSTIRFKGLECTDCDVTIRMVPDASSLGATDELPIPLGSEAMALDLAAKWFFRQVALPIEQWNDNKPDVN
jgi:hypothetical protein